jgi:hypothetical protein
MVFFIKQCFSFSTFDYTSIRRKIRLIEGNEKLHHLKKLIFKSTLRQVFICVRPPPLLGFCLDFSALE